MKPNKLLNGRFRPLAGLLLRVAALGVLAGSAPAWAGFATGLTEERCMADAFGGSTNCTSEDVRIAEVIALDPNQECFENTLFEFQADVKIETTANERYDTTFYLPLTADSPQVPQNNLPNCSLLVPLASEATGVFQPKPKGGGGTYTTAYVNIDGDQCGDITKNTSNGSGTYTVLNQTIKMRCTAGPDGRALFNYCAAWDNQSRSNCSVSPTATPYSGQVPNTPAKCKCGSFPINVRVRPTPPTLTKTVEPATRTEPGGEFVYNVGFTNTGPAPVVITGLTDKVDVGGNGSYADANDKTINLWGATQSVGTADGVYLINNTNCTKPIAPATTVTVAANGGTYSCQFTLHIKDRDLPDDQSPEKYIDFVIAQLVDQSPTPNPVGDGSTCPTGFKDPGKNCSPARTVEITNLPPSITVTKVPTPDEVMEPGGDVTFAVTVTNTSGAYDTPLNLTSLIDDKFGDLDGKGDCVIGSGVSLSSSFSCSFTEHISGNANTTHTNKVTAIALDDEGDDATADATATVDINDVPSAITLEKTADPTTVPETGVAPNDTRPVDYTFRFSVDAGGVDTVTFDTLIDDKFGDLTAQCLVNMKNGLPISPTPLAGFQLEPGEYASCTINDLPVSGNANTSHTNLATIRGHDEDNQPVDDNDDATVNFTNVPPNMDSGFALKATVFLKVKNTSIENIFLKSLKILGVTVRDGASLPGSFVLKNEGGEFGSFNLSECQEPDNAVPPVYALSLAPNGEYSCAFSVEFAPDFHAGGFNLFTSPIINSDAVVVEFVDEEGSPVSADAEATITTTD